MQRPHAVALQYHEGLYAPKVVAKGSGAIAEEIIRRATEAGVYVHASTDLVQLLMRVDLDEHIPPVLYLAVAEILAWVRRLDQPAAALPAAHPTGSNP
jgi:flagellar biosynthesis protein